MKRKDYMLPGRCQLVPRGRWHDCRYEERTNGLVCVLVGPRTYTVPTEQVRTKKGDPL